MIWTNANKYMLDGNTLELEDIVEFHIPYWNGYTNITLKYKVYSSCLLGMNGGSLSIPKDLQSTRGIFTYLGYMDYPSVSRLCELAYCYKLPGSSGSWPYSKANDFPALTRLVKALYTKIAEKSAKSPSPIDSLDKWLNESHFLEELRKKSNGLYIQSVEVNSNNSNSNNFKDGKTIKVNAVTPKIIRGEENRGCNISGKASRSNITGGSLSYAEILA